MGLASNKYFLGVLLYRFIYEFKLGIISITDPGDELFSTNDNVIKTPTFLPGSPDPVLIYADSLCASSCSSVFSTKQLSLKFGQSKLELSLFTSLNSQTLRRISYDLCQGIHYNISREKSCQNRKGLVIKTKYCYWQKSR